MQVRNLYDLKEKYQIPLEVIEEVGRIVKLLDGVYGSERDVENDDGGYVLLLLSDNDSGGNGVMYHRLLEEYHLRHGTAEEENIICRCGGVEWCVELYLTTNDYGVTVVYAK